MDYYNHSKEIEYLHELPLNISNLNHFEVMGLCLLGQISIGKLRSLYGIERDQSIKMMEDVLKVIESYVPNDCKLRDNFVSAI